MPCCGAAKKQETKKTNPFAAMKKTQETKKLQPRPEHSKKK